MTIPYTYGTFVLHDNQTYFVEKFDDSWVDVAEATTKIARLDGLKKTGEIVNDRNLKITVSVLPPAGTRAALEAALDALDAALYKRQQNLVVKSDGRYFVADCISNQLVINQPAYAALELTFWCSVPYASATAASTSTLNSTWGGSSGVFSASPNITNTGTILAYPQIDITNTGAVTMSNLVIINNTDGYQISLSSAVSLAAGETVHVACDPYAGYKIWKGTNTSTLYDFSGAFPVMEVGVNNWKLSCTAVSAPTVSVVWTWTPRYLR